jgi:ATP-dependent helicase/nuclease subunit B
VKPPAVYTIPPHRAFADALVAGLLARFPDRLEMARGAVLLPTNRAVRAITDAFVRRAEGGLLLPRLIPIGDADLEERLGAALDPIDDDPIPPAIDPMARRMRLARAIQRERARIGQPVDAAEAIRLAADLARTIDQLHVEQVPAHRLREIPIADDLSTHWRRSLDQLQVIIDQWPAELATLGRIDLTDRRNRLLERLARRWGEAPPDGFVVAAGIATTAPAVAGLLRRIASMPRGMVVFSALDFDMPEDDWPALGPHDPDPDTGRRPRSIETHPQYHLKLLLDRMGIGRGEVERWRWGGGHDAAATRSRAISNALAPAESTKRWAELSASERSLAGVNVLEVATPAEEAQAIAIALREALETPGRTAALVTPDRGLATRVSAHLRRWNIFADDSAGQPLSLTPPGGLLIAIAEAVAERFAPVPLLSLLKHPLVSAGERRGEWLEGARLLDRALRGPRPAPGLDGIDAFLNAGDDRQRLHRRRALAWWTQVRPLLEPLEAAPDTLAGQIAAIREAVDRLAGDEAWARPAGRAAAELLESIEANAVDGPADTTAAAMPALIGGLAREIAVRPPQGGHPRVAILGLLEARLQQADLMILGGLNEGVWPALAAPDPWLAPSIRSALGLPGLETRIGLSAHDFASALGAPQLLITRARRDAGAPAIASRLWLRLQAMIGDAQWKRMAAPGLAGLARGIDRPTSYTPAARPTPSPPLAARPRTISVTDVDRLKADPYAFYARSILRLSTLEAIDEDATAAWRGTAVHAVLEAWAKEDDCDPPALRPRAEAMLRGAGTHPIMRALWGPRLLEAIDWIAATITAGMAERRRPIAVEAWGSAEIAGVKLGGRADRIDRLAGGGIAIVDYKTGMAPGAAQVRAGYAQQLGLIGLIAENGGFEGVTGVAAAFEYWSLARNKEGGFGLVSSPVHETGARERIVTADFTRVAHAVFAEAAGKWLTGEEAFVAKLSPEYATYADYDQLMRLDEWYGRGD